MTVVEVGSIAPDFSLGAANGRAVSLSGALQNRRGVLLVFLRHLG